MHNFSIHHIPSIKYNSCKGGIDVTSFCPPPQHVKTCSFGKVGIWPWTERPSCLHRQLAQYNKRVLFLKSFICLICETNGLIKQKVKNIFKNYSLCFCFIFANVIIIILPNWRLFGWDISDIILKREESMNLRLFYLNVQNFDLKIKTL